MSEFEPNLRARLFGWVRNDRVFLHLISNSGWLFSSDGITNILRFCQGALLARMLGVKEYGILALVLTYSSTVNQVLDSRVWEAAIKFITQYVEAGKNEMAAAFIKLSYLIDLLTAILTFILLVITAGLAANVFLKQPGSANYIQLYSITILMAVPVGTGSALLRIFDRFDWIAYLNIGSVFLRLAGVLLVWLVGGGIVGIIWVYIVTNGINAAGTLILSRKATLKRVRLYWFFAPLRALKGEVREITRFLLSTNANAFCKLLQRNVDTLLVGYFMTPVAVGYFRLARMMTDVMGLPVGTLETACYPEFARLWHQNRLVELRRLVLKLASLSAIFGAGGLLVYVLVGRWMIIWSVGRQYLPALSALRLLAVAVALAIATCFAYSLLLAMGRAPQTLFAIAAGVAVQVPLLVLWIPRLGINGAAAAYIIFYVVWIAAIFHFLRRPMIGVTV